MSLAAGTRLAHYEILEAIGKGGMGEVYRAKDSKLGRDVAIKVLPDELARDEERLRRFQREAKVLASLNHPNIAAIYGVEQQGATHYLVLELVEGETLAERIARGPIPKAEALDIARQIADALEAAHGQGIVHRDLKPANVKRTPDDQIKVLDFGLAKASTEETPEADSSMSPTITRDATHVGVILGTAAYMSPEQAKGKPVDKRSDIFSFGVLLYEMLTGRRAFAADDIHETLAAVINKDVDWDALASDTPPSIRRLLRRSLVKDRRERLADIADARIEINESNTVDERAATPSLEAGWRRTLTVALLASAVVGVVVGAMVWSARAPSPRPVARLAVTPPPNEGIRLLLDGPGIAVTPDGSKIIYTTGNPYDRRLVVRPLDQLTTDTLVLSRRSVISTPFVSPDGAWVGFRDGNELKKVSMAGGSSSTICALDGSLRGASWGDEGTIVFATSRRDGLYVVPVEGGEPQLLVSNESHRLQWPEFLPGSRAVLFNIDPSSGYDNETEGRETRVAVYDLDTGEQRALFDGEQAHYASSGHIIYGRDEGLYAVPFDAERLEVRGEHRPVVEQVFSKVTDAVDFSVSRNGVLAYLPGRTGAGDKRRLAWVGRDGVATDTEFGEARFADAAVSPDGTKIATEAARNVWIYDVERGTRLNLIPDDGVHPLWTPDGRRVVFEIAGSGLYWVDADGSGAVEPLVESDALTRPGSWSPDGAVFAYTQAAESGLDIMIRSDEGTTPFLRTRFNEDGPMFSPDGHWLAYTSDESGLKEVYIAPFPGPGGREPVSVGGGRAPVWSPVGNELFYRDLEGRMFAVTVESDPRLTVGQPELLFDSLFYSVPAGDPHYDVSRDGTRFLMIDESTADAAGLLGAAYQRSSGTSSSRMIVILNWFEELKRLVPADN